METLELPDSMLTSGCFSSWTRSLNFIFLVSFFLLWAYSFCTKETGRGSLVSLREPLRGMGRWVMSGIIECWLR
jgi:hypothetical protein